MISLP
jgi:hypothetical protein